MDKANLKYAQVFAVVRFDEPTVPENWRNAISIVKVFADRNDAEAEVARLTKINDRSKCEYEVVLTRFGS